jgi:hypothetical protein
MQAILRAKNSEKWLKKCFPRPVSEPVQQEMPPTSSRPTHGRAPSCPQGVANSRMKEFCGIHCPRMKDFLPRATQQLMLEGCNCNWSLQNFPQRNVLLASSGWKSKQSIRLHGVILFYSEDGSSMFNRASHSSTLKMGSVRPSETLVPIPDYMALHSTRL